MTDPGGALGISKEGAANVRLQKHFAKWYYSHKGEESVKGNEVPRDRVIARAHMGAPYANAALNAIPVTKPLQMTNGPFIHMLQMRLGIMPRVIKTLPPYCQSCKDVPLGTLGAHLWACKKNMWCGAGEVSRQVQMAVYDAATAAGCHCMLEPVLNPEDPAAKADVVIYGAGPNGEAVLTDITITHPLCPTYETTGYAKNGLTANQAELEEAHINSAT